MTYGFDINFKRFTENFMKQNDFTIQWKKITSRGIAEANIWTFEGK